MLQSLVVRTLLMISHGARLSDAVTWVIRRLPRNLQTYYRWAIHQEVINACR